MTNASAVPARYQLRIKQRLKVVEYARSSGIRAASRHFNLTRKTIRAWRDRFAAAGIGGLVPRYPKHRKGRLPDELLALLRQARVDLGYGAGRTRVWLRRLHGRDVHVGTIQQAFRRMGIPHLPNRSKRGRGLAR